MGVRVIATKLAIDGEQEYRDKMRSVNDELKTLGTALSLVESNFKGQANSMDALTAKGGALQNLYDKQADKVKELAGALENAQSAQSAYVKRVESAKTALSSAEAEMERLKNSAEDTATAQKKLADEINRLGNELEESAAHETAAARGVNEWQRQLNTAKTTLNNLDSELKQNKQYLTEADKAADKCATSIDRYGKQAKEAATATGDTAEKGGLLQKIFAGGFLANIATQALNAVWSTLKNLATQAMETADELMKMSDITGQSVESLQALQYIGDDLGISLDTIEGAQRKLTKSMSEASQGTEDYANAFKSLGVSAVDPTTGALRDSTDVMYEVMDALGKVSNETERDVLAMQLFGKSAMELNPLIKAGSEQLKSLSDEAKNTGAVMSEDAVEALDAFGDSMDHIGQKAEAFVGEVLAAIASGGKTAAESMQDLTDGIGRTQGVMELIEQYEQLQLELSNSGLSEEAAAAKTDELNRVKQELIDVSGGVVTALGLENGSYDEQVSTLKGLNETHQEIYMQQLAALALANTGAVAEKKRSDAIADSNRLYGEYIDSLKSVNDVAQGDWLTQFMDGFAAFDLNLKSAAEQAAYFKLGTDNAAASIAQLGVDAAAGQEALAKLIEVSGSVEAAASYLGITVEDLNTRLAGAAGAVQLLSAAEQNAATVLDEFAQKVDDLQVSYNEMYASATEAINGTIGLWEEMDASAIKTAEEVKSALQSQIDWLNNYDMNLTALENRKISGVDLTPLLTSLSDGTEESAAILSGLRAATDDEVRQIVESFNRVGEGKDTLASNMAQVKTEFLENIESMTNEAIAKMAMADQAGDAANDTMQGYIDGIYDKQDAVVAAFRETAKAANQGFKDELEIKSPSKVAVKTSGYYWEGIMLAARQNEEALAAQFAETAGKANKAAQTAMPSSVDIPQRDTGASAAQIGDAISKSLNSGISGESKTITINLTAVSQLDGRQIAKSTYKYNVEESSLQGTNLIE